MTKEDYIIQKLSVLDIHIREIVGALIKETENEDLAEFLKLSWTDYVRMSDQLIEDWEKSNDIKSEW